jgi:hypothetical protein
MEQFSVAAQFWVEQLAAPTPAIPRVPPVI